MQDVLEADHDLQTVVAKEFLPRMITAILLSRSSAPLEKAVVRDFWLTLRGSLYRCRRALYRIAGINNPQRLDSYMHPWVRRELGAVEAQEYPLRVKHAAFEERSNGVLYDMLEQGRTSKGVADEIRKLIREILNP